MTDAVQLAKGVLAAEGQPFATLSLAANLPPVTADTSVADARRSYMRLAGAIHPDRLQGSFDKATEAFQCLVRAFECFADPKLRKKAAAEAAKKAKAAAAASPVKKEEAAAPAKRKSKKDAKVKREKAAKAPKKQPKRAGKTAVEESDAEESEPAESDEESDANSDEGDGDWETWAAADGEPEVSTSRTPIGQPRVGGLYHQTTVGCPKCRTSWEPDSRPQYSLFMGQWGRRVHCQLCLFDFGSATAMHACPHCRTGFDYDASMYDEVQQCAKCKKQFGFAYYPVNQHLIDQIALEEWRARKEREKAAEREARARARHGGGAGATSNKTDKAAADTEEEMQLLVGSCVVNEECPLCHQRVKSHHRSHVVECAAKAPAERAAAGKTKKATGQQMKTAAAAGKKEVAKKPAAKPAVKPAPKAAPKVAGKKSPKATATSRKRRRGGSSSDDDDDDEDDSEASLSDSEEEDMSSESSFSDDDDDSD